MQMSACLLSLVSPVLRTMICGDFKESATKEICLEDVEGKVFVELLLLACGDDGRTADSINDLFELGGLADRLQMSAIASAMEEMLIKEINTETCAEILQTSELHGMLHTRNCCRKMLQDWFLEVSQTEGFLGLVEETLSDVLEEDELGVRWEKDTLAAVIRWMENHEERRMEGGRLLRKIRYGLIEDDDLAESMLLDNPAKKVLSEIYDEAMFKKGKLCCGELEWDGEERLCEKWALARKMPFPIINLPPSRASLLLEDFKFHSPRCVAMDRDGRILVTDFVLDEIIFFSGDDPVAKRLSLKGKASEEGPGPMGIAFDLHGYMVVSSYRKDCIEVLNANGSVVCSFGRYGTALGEFRCSSGVAVDRKGNIVIADSGNDRVQIFTGAGILLQCFGSTGSAVGQLYHPTAVALDAVGHIVVADTSNHRVQVFNSDGTVALCFGSNGAGPGQFDSPRGVAVDREGRFVVTDCNNHRIQVFNADGSVARIIGAEHSKVKGLNYPCGVAVDGAGRIVVTEPGICSSQARVQLFEI